MRTSITMKSEHVLKSMGLNIDPYPADAIFSEKYIGSYSDDRLTACLMLEDNLTPEEIEGLEGCILPLDTVKEIAYTVNTLVTNFGLGVHSHTMKINPFSTLNIIKL